MKRRTAIRIELTRDQREQIRRATGKDATAIELDLRDLREQLSTARGSRSRKPRKAYVVALFG